MPARQDEVMVVRTLAFMIARQVLCLVGLGPSPDAKDVEIAVLRLYRAKTVFQAVSWGFVGWIKRPDDTR
jgi:hypothetical protein